MGWKDKAENTKDQAVGAVEERVGRATDDEQMEHEGQKEQAKSNLKQAGEKVKDAVRDL